MSQLKIRPITAQDEPLLASWWVSHGSAIIPAAYWPKHGFVVDEALAGFLIGTDAYFALAEWYVSKPGYDKLKRKEAMRLLTKSLCELGKSLGYTAVITIVEKRPLVKFFKEEGFNDDASNLISLVKGL